MSEMANKVDSVHKSDRAQKSEIIRIVLIDDQNLVRQGIKSLLSLSDRVEVVAEADNGKDGLDIIQSYEPDVVLLDLRMPELDGIGMLEKLQSEAYKAPVLILTTFDDDSLVLSALRHGAKGYLLKDVSLEQLVEAIETIAAGGTLIQPALTERLIKAMSGLSDSKIDKSYNTIANIEALTEREGDVLRLMAGGYNNKEIAKMLGNSTGTIKNHVSNILSKLGVKDRTKAVLKALELGII